MARDLGTATIGVVGLGTMGAGIAQVALENGHEVVVYEVDEAAIARGRIRIGDGLRRRAAKANLDAEATEARIEEQLGRLRSAETLASLGGQADVVIEAAIEDLALKQSVFRALDDAAGPEAILASNTSALSITAIAAATSRPERVVGLHFFNPAPIMALVEVVAPAAADEDVVAAASALVEGWGKAPVRCADAPGFIVNRVNRPFTLEALRILEIEASTIGVIDTAIRGAGFPMGPFEFMDLVGLDVNLAAATALYDAFGHAVRFTPSPIQERLVVTDQLGRKRGSGFYVYDEGGSAVEPSAEFAGEPRNRSPLDAGSIVDRIVLSIVNEAFHALGDGVASRSDIDLALRLGANHPRGPFQWAEERGMDRVYAGLEALRQAEGDRFAPAPALLEASAI